MFVFFCRKVSSPTWFVSVADEAKKLPISRRLQFQTKVLALMAEVLEEPPV